MVCVISMWLISLVLSLTAALISTLLPQWARRYVSTPHHRPAEKNHRARVRSFLLHGTVLYKMHLIDRLAPTLLHFSVYLFFAGLVVLFHTIDKNVAIVVDVSVGAIAVAFIVLSVLPCLDVSCPYRTPMTYILWYPLHTILYFVSLLLCWFVELLHGFLVQPSLDNVVSHKQRILIGWLESRNRSIKTHWRYIMDGLGKSVINRAISTQGDGDRKIVTMLFNLAMDDRNKLQKLAASIPRGRVLELIPLIEDGRIVLEEPLAILLRSCTESARVAGPDEDVRKRSLLVCLDAIYHIAKAPHVPDLNLFSAKFADIRLMRTLWNDSDPSIRFTSRSICAFLAKKVIREDSHSRRLWLCGVIGEAPGTMQSVDIVRQDHMNLRSFFYGVLSNELGDLLTESFKETLATLLNVGTDVNFERPHSQICLSNQVRWIQREDPRGSHRVADQLRSMFSFLPPPPTLPLFTPPPTPPLMTPPAGEVPSHSGMPFVNPHSLLTPRPSNVTVPLSIPQSTHGHFRASNVQVPFGL